MWSLVQARYAAKSCSCLVRVLIESERQMWFEFKQESKNGGFHRFFSFSYMFYN